MKACYLNHFKSVRSPSRCERSSNQRVQGLLAPGEFSPGIAFNSNNIVIVRFSSSLKWFLVWRWAILVARNLRCLKLSILLPPSSIRLCSLLSFSSLSFVIASVLLLSLPFQRLASSFKYLSLFSCHSKLVPIIPLSVQPSTP